MCQLWQPCAHRPRQGQIGGSRHQALDAGYPRGVVQRHLAGKVVVERPKKAGQQHGQRGPQRFRLCTPQRVVLRPAEQQSPRNNGGHTQRNTLAQAFLEHGPCQQGGQNRFGIEQQGRVAGRHAREAKHQQHRRHHAATQHGGQQPAGFVPAQARRGGAPNQPVKPQAQARPEVEQPGQHPRTDLIQQPLGQRRTCAKQKGRSQRRQDALVPGHAGFQM